MRTRSIAGSPNKIVGAVTRRGCHTTCGGPGWLGPALRRKLSRVMRLASQGLRDVGSCSGCCARGTECECLAGGANATLGFMNVMRAATTGECQQKVRLTDSDSPTRRSQPGRCIGNDRPRKLQR
jgi:hypothetical protein